MKESRISMGMPASVQIIGAQGKRGIDAVFAYFEEVDRRFSPYKSDSEVGQLNHNPAHVPSAELSEILMIAELTRVESGGFFDIRRPDGRIDPSGVVKGWAIQRAADLLTQMGFNNFCIDLGGDIAFSGVNEHGALWKAGIRNPFNHEEVVKALQPRGQGMATSGSAARGNHIYNPHQPLQPVRDIVSITVVGPDVLTADRYATAAFAMGKEGINFIEAIPACEAYQISADGIATMTSGFADLTLA